MIIHGLQKMTTLDFPGKIAATVFTVNIQGRILLFGSTKVNIQRSFFCSREGIGKGSALCSTSPMNVKQMIISNCIT